MHRTLPARFFVPLLAPLLALALNAAAAAAPPAPAVAVASAWARPTVAGQGAGGGFLTIAGAGADDRLVAASTPVSKAVEFHTMEMDGSVMRMRELPAIDVPAGQAVALKPGGRHLMFVGLRQALKPGTRFPLTLRFEKAGEVVVDVEVRVSAPK